MKRMIVLAGVLAFAAGCTGGGDDPAAEETATAGPDGPYELQLSTPAGFLAAEDVERAAYLSEDHLDWVFQLEGGDGTAQIAVSSYELPENVDVSDREAQIALILPYDKELGNASQSEKVGTALVHRVEGLHRYYYAEPASGGYLEGHFYYLFSGSHLIQISCEWGAGGGGGTVQQACMEMFQEFPFPEGWSA